MGTNDIVSSLQFPPVPCKVEGCTARVQSQLTGHEVCRSHSSCAVWYKGHRYWDPSTCQICLLDVDYIRLWGPSFGTSKARLSYWLKGFAKTAKQGVGYIVSEELRALVAPKAKPVSVFDPASIMDSEPSWEVDMSSTGVPDSDQGAYDASDEDIDTDQEDALLHPADLVGQQAQGRSESEYSPKSDPLAVPGSSKLLDPLQFRGTGFLSASAFGDFVSGITSQLSTLQQSVALPQQRGSEPAAPSSG